MSYILDALKKSDQERQQGGAPNLHSTHGAIIPMDNSATFTRRHILWMLGGGLLIVLLSLASAFFLYQQFLKDKPVRQEAQVTTSRQIEKTKLTTTGSAPQTLNKTLQASEDQQNQIAHPPIEKIPVELEERPYPPAVLVKERDTILKSIPVNKREIVRPEAETETTSEDVPFLSDLSPQIQAEIPELNFAAHTYATEPSQRMIIVNGTIVREGELIAPRTYLVEITWEGVTVKFNSITFRVKAN